MKKLHYFFLLCLSAALMFACSHKDDPNVPVSGVSLNNETLSLVEGATAVLTATVVPENATNKTIAWASDKPEVAKVENGTVTALQVGEATITVTTADGAKTAACKVTVTPKPVPVTGVELDKATLELMEGESAVLTATVAPENATNKEVTWASDKLEVAKVEDGTVTAVQTGEATITVTTADGAKTASCKVIVTPKPISVTSVELDKNRLELIQGATATLTATVLPENATNKEVTWASDKPAVARVEGGKVTAVGYGEATITVTTTDGAKTASCEVVVSPQTEYEVKGVKFKMVLVEGGSFTMGGTAEQGGDALGEEKPTHTVRLSSFLIGETEVTQALWKAVMENNPSSFPSGDDYPVESVTWEECQQFLERLNSLTGKKFSLPTEAQWEYAARGGQKSGGYKYSGGNELADIAWYSENSENATHPVKTKTPNELGIYDMSGNVSEWCQDWYGDYTPDNQTNPKGPSTGEFRIRRGGGWYHTARGCRISARSYTYPSRQYNFLGLRLAL